MAGWKKVSFEALKDVSPAEVPIEWRFSRHEVGSPEIGVSRFTYEPGARMPWGHRHHRQEEVYVVVEGSGRANLDGEIIDLETWDVLRVAPSVIRSFEAGEEGMNVICIGGSKPEGGDTERFEDFWV